MATFLAVVIVDIDIGLGVGVLASVTVLIYRGHHPYAATLGHLKGTEMHVDVKLYSTAIEVPGIKIFRWVMNSYLFFKLRHYNNDDILLLGWRNSLCKWRDFSACRR
jgi:MFS superfamily sulfate permease-like transporter